MIRRPPRSTLFPTRRSSDLSTNGLGPSSPSWVDSPVWSSAKTVRGWWASSPASSVPSPSFSERSEEHTSELQSQSNLVCRLLLEKKKQKILTHNYKI